MRVHKEFYADPTISSQYWIRMKTGLEKLTYEKIIEFRIIFLTVQESFQSES